MVYIISALPILCLLVCLLLLKLSGQKASAVSFLSVTAIYLFYFKSGSGIMISMAKGFGLGSFVVLIIWGAMFLYNLVEKAGALEVISETVGRSVEDKLIQLLFLSWIFASFLQGIAGFGVPVIVVVPILISLGFSPETAAAAVLIGHSWSISFGSMGSSVYAIDLVTRTNLNDIVLNMSILGTISMLCTGISICILFGGRNVLQRGIVYVFTVSVFMGATLFVMAKLQMYSILGLAAGVVGSIAMFIICRIDNKISMKYEAIEKGRLGILHAIMPYIVIIILSITFYIIDPKWEICFDFPGYETLRGRIIDIEDNYVKFNLLKFPLIIIMMAAIISGGMFWKNRVLKGEDVKTIVQNTIKKCVPATVTIVFLLITAVVMMDSGMIENLAYAVVKLSGKTYPLVSSFIGLLGAFITGSNTNSNILFGSFQEIAADTLGYSTAIICAVHSIGASIGGAIGPTTVALGVTAAQIQGREVLVYRKTLIPILTSEVILGIIAFVLVR